MKRRIVLISLMTAFLWMQAEAGTPAESRSNPEAQGGVAFAARLSIASVPEITFNEFDNDYYMYDEPLASIYADYAGRIGTSGNITASLDLIFSGRCALSVDLGFTVLWKEMYNGITCEPRGYSSTGVALYLMPQFKFFYLKRPIVRLYGDIGLGMTKYFGEDFRNRIGFSGQFSPFGIEIGRKFFGFAEIGIGTTYFGIRGGFGYKF